MFAVRAAVGASARPALRERRVGGRACTRSGRSRRAVGDDTDAWMTRDVPPPLPDVPHESGDARSDTPATTSETRVASEDAETGARFSPRSTDGRVDASRRDTTETESRDDDVFDDARLDARSDAAGFVATNATETENTASSSLSKTTRESEKDARGEMGERPFDIDFETWRARVASLARSLEDKNAVAVDRDAVERRFNEAAARVADALPADLAAALARAAALAPSCAASVGWLARRDATRAAEDGTARFEAILGAVVAETRATRRETTRRTKKNAFRSGTDGARVAESNAASEVGEDKSAFPASTVTFRSFPKVSDEDAPAFLFVRGLFGEHYPCYQWDAVEHFRARGATARLSSSARGDRTTKANADALCAEILAFADALGADTAGNQRRVVLVGHSKGGVDACAALALHEHRLKDIVLGVITVQSPYGGSPVASDLTATPAMRSLTERALEVLLRAPKGVGSKTLLPALLDVTYEKRMAFLEHHPLPCRFPCVSFHSAVKSPSGVLALGAAYVKNRYGSDSDGLVCGADAEVPGCVAVRYGADYDHADGAYPRAMSDERYRRYVENISPDGEKEGFEINAFSPDVEETKKSAFFSSRFESVGEREGASENTENSDGDVVANEMVPSAEARARALRDRDERERRGEDGARFSGGAGFFRNEEFSSGNLTALAFELVSDLKRALDRRRDGDARYSAEEAEGKRKGEDPSCEKREEPSGDGSSMRTSAPPAGAGTLLVRAYLALNAAVPERLGSTADQGEVHEALASLLMERAESKREEEFSEW